MAGSAGNEGLSELQEARQCGKRRRKETRRMGKARIDGTKASWEKEHRLKSGACSLYAVLKLCIIVGGKFTLCCHCVV